MQTATPPRYSLDDVEEFLSDVRGFPSKLEAVDHVIEHYPHLRESWVRDRWGYFQCLDPWALVAIIGYPDPTGEKATRRADMAAAS